MNIAELNRRVSVWEFVEERDEFGVDKTERS